MGSQDEVLKEVKRKKLLFVLGIIISGLCGLIGIVSGETVLTFISFGFVLASIIGFSVLKDFGQNLTDYYPGQRFKFFRKTREAKLRTLTYAQYILAGLLVVSMVLGLSAGLGLVYGVGGILFIQFYQKRRIKLHTKIDDASLFELEEIGIITSKDSVKAIYKDFQSWNRIMSGHKLLLVTQDALIYVIIEDQEEAVRMECRLRDIRKLGVIGHGKRGEGLLVSIGTSDNQTFRVKLDGASSQDSPEEFFTHFLEALDNALSPSTQPAQQRRHSIDLPNGKNSNTATMFNHNPTPRINIRKVDIFDQAAAQELHIL